MKKLVLLCLFAVMTTIVNGEIVEVMFETNFGDIALELYPDDAPVTVANFLNYVNDGFYDGQIIHRVISDFVIQGGLFNQNLERITPTFGAIVNESYNGLKNLRGTIAMARTVEPHSATSQFFINHVDNQFLDFGEIAYDSSNNAYYKVGYCVFGRVIEGMNVVDAIAVTPTTTQSVEGFTYDDFPINPTVDIYRAYVVPEPSTCLLLLGALPFLRKRKA